MGGGGVRAMCLRGVGPHPPCHLPQQGDWVESSMVTCWKEITQHTHRHTHRFTIHREHHRRAGTFAEAQTSINSRLNSPHFRATEHFTDATSGVDISIFFSYCSC